MKKGGISAILLLAFLVVIAGSSVTRAAWIKDMQISLPANETVWFNCSSTHPEPPSTFQPKVFNNPTITMSADIIINTYETIYYGYSIKNATFNMTACNLLNDNSGSLANGEFAGGSTLTLNGELWKKDPVTHVETQVTDPGLLLSANMVAGSWILSETSFSTVSGQKHFDPPSGELVTGAVSELKMGAFRADFFFQLSTDVDTGAWVSDFSTGSYKGMTSSVQIIAPIPEPVSMLLLAFGAGVVGLRRK